MYDLQDITRRLLAAGHATSVGGSGIDLLDVDPNTRHLTYKRLPHPPVSSPSASRHPLRFARLATTRIMMNGLMTIMPRITRRTLTVSLLDGSWVPTVLPGNPVEGTPLSALVVGGKVQLFYVSASDNCLHYVSQQQNGRWFDVIFATYAFDVKQPKQLFVTQNDSGVIEGYVLTDDNALLKITADATLTSLGTVDSSGTFVPSPPVNPGGTTGPGSIPNKPYNPPPPPATTGDQHFNQQAASGRTTIQGWPWGNIVISP